MRPSNRKFTCTPPRGHPSHPEQRHETAPYDDSTRFARERRSLSGTAGIIRSWDTGAEHEGPGGELTPAGPAKFALQGGSRGKRTAGECGRITTTRGPHNPKSQPKLGRRKTNVFQFDGRV